MLICLHSGLHGGFPLCGASIIGGRNFVQSGHHADVSRGKSQLLSHSGEGEAEELSWAEYLDLRVANEILSGPTQVRYPGRSNLSHLSPVC